MLLYLSNIFVQKDFHDPAKVLSMSSLICMHKEEGVAGAEEANAV